jgi:TetR/AcrR family transcriptional regulator
VRAIGIMVPAPVNVASQCEVPRAGVDSVSLVGEVNGEAAVDANKARPLGRPRARQRVDHNMAPRDEIIAVAARLFAEKGFAQTTMRDIAYAAGLRQSSLYYYFNRKELILNASFAVNSAPLDFIRRLDSGSPGLRLYRFVRFDTRQLCLSPWDVNEVERLADRHPDLFVSLWRDRQDLHDLVVALIQEGIEDGQFTDSDPSLTALGITSFDEGIQNWFRSQDQHRPGGNSPFVYPSYNVDQVSEFLATAALRLVLVEPDDLDTIKQEAAAFDDSIPSVPSP